MSVAKLAAGAERQGLKRWWPLLAGCSAVPLALLVGFVSGGAGHGDYVWARLLLPFACMDLGRPGKWWIIVPLAIMQWPAYGLGVSLPRRLQWRIVAASIAGGLHIVGVVLMFTIMNEGFR